MKINPLPEIENEMDVQFENTVQGKMDILEYRKFLETKINDTETIKFMMEIAICVKDELEMEKSLKKDWLSQIVPFLGLFTLVAFMVYGAVYILSSGKTMFLLGGAWDSIIIGSGTYFLYRLKRKGNKREENVNKIRSRFRQHLYEKQNKRRFK